MATLRKARAIPIDHFISLNQFLGSVLDQAKLRDLQRVFYNRENWIKHGPWDWEPSGNLKDGWSSFTFNITPPYMPQVATWSQRTIAWIASYRFIGFGLPSLKEIFVLVTLITSWNFLPRICQASCGYLEIALFGVRKPGAWISRNSAAIFAVIGKQQSTGFTNKWSIYDRISDNLKVCYAVRVASGTCKCLLFQRWLYWTAHLVRCFICIFPRRKI